MAKKRSAAKKSSGSAKHQSFKLSSHSYPKDKVVLYIVMAAIIGFGIGWLFRDQFASAFASAGF